MPSSSILGLRRQSGEKCVGSNFEALKPNQKCVTDVTQYRVKDSWLYLPTIKDLCQNEIVAYNMSLRNDKDLVLQTFSKAFEKEKDVTGLIVHSDQGRRSSSHWWSCRRTAPHWSSRIGWPPSKTPTGSSWCPSKALPSKGNMRNLLRYKAPTTACIRRNSADSQYIIRGCFLC
ncbi:hypothetical protein ET464_18735 [Paenibacillus protaetiae]|uniref:Integrase catalytic domain-containing protein n=1 Tax=Paenibacillus protaetiae TaxID=2509456 RepID=A0A4P6EZM4_9BACL|nr:hypothetical protein ET464_18735 [Paenibacillus protaetiae]